MKSKRRRQKAPKEGNMWQYKTTFFSVGSSQSLPPNSSSPGPSNGFLRVSNPWLWFDNREWTWWPVYGRARTRFQTPFWTCRNWKIQPEKERKEINKFHEILHISPVHVLLSRFYPDFILILSWFYPNFIQIKSR